MRFKYNLIYVKTAKEYLKRIKQGYAFVYIDRSKWQEVYEILKANKDKNNSIKYTYLTFIYNNSVDLKLDVKDEYIKAEAQKMIDEGYYGGYSILIYYAFQKEEDELLEYCLTAIEHKVYSAYYFLAMFYSKRKEYDKCLYYTKEGIKRGVSNCEYYLARCYMDGDVVPKDEKKGFYMLRNLADKNMKAKISLGHYYLAGLHGIKQSKYLGFTLLNEAANQGLFGAINYVSLCYKFGWGVLKDLNKSKEWDEYGVLKGVPECYYRLARIYRVKKDYKKALELFEEGYEKTKNPNCLEGLADLYFEGLGVPQDKEKGEEYLLRAYNEGSSFAALVFGGRELKKGDYRKALEYFLKSDIFGIERYIGYCYYQLGEYDKAYQNLQKAYDEGYRKNLFFLGLLYLNGQYVETDTQKGLGILHECAKEDDYYAAVAIAEYLTKNTNSHGRDVDDAIKWIEHVISHTKDKKCLGKAFYLYGRIYQYGMNGKFDKCTAKTWYNKALECGYTEAQERLDELK